MQSPDLVVSNHLEIRHTYNWPKAPYWYKATQLTCGSLGTSYSRPQQNVWSGRCRQVDILLTEVMQVWSYWLQTWERGHNITRQCKEHVWMSTPTHLSVVSWVSHSNRRTVWSETALCLWDGQCLSWGGVVRRPEAFTVITRVKRNN